MFGQWRLTLRQAEEAIRSERFEEALELARRPEIADHRQAGKLRDKIADRLVDRARVHLQQGHSQAAWHDLQQAELAGALSAKVGSVRDELTERGAAEVRTALEAGNPDHAMALVEDLKARGGDSAELRRMHEAAGAWSRAQRAARIGEFSRAVEFLEAARKQLASHVVLENKWRSVQADRERATDLKHQLQRALVDQEWDKVLHSADAFLDLAPECREVRHTRDEALRRLGVQVTSAPIRRQADLDEASPMRSPIDTKNGSRGRFILWVDGSGGYLVCQGSVVTVGQANPGTTVDIPILGDLSRNHATFIRDGEGYLVRSERDLTVTGRATRQTALRHGDVIRLGRSVELKFSIPCPVSETARLVLVSRHRLHLSLEGILLMAETCVLGPSEQAHVQVPEATGQVVLYRQGGGLCCRGDGVLEIDGQTHEGRGPLRMPSRASVGDLSFSLEPLGSPLSQV